MNQPQKIAPELTHQPTKDEQIFEQILVLAKLKSEEARIKIRRIKIEENIVDLVGVKDEGSKTYKTIGLSQNLKVVTTGNISRKVDKELLKEKWDELSEKAIDCFKFQPEVVTANFKLAKDNEDLFLEIAEIVTEKSNKPSLKIEMIEAK